MTFSNQTNIVPISLHGWMNALGVCVLGNWSSCMNRSEKITRCFEIKKARSDKDFWKIFFFHKLKDVVNEQMVGCFICVVTASTQSALQFSW
jgi:hypothetical protein